MIDTVVSFLKNELDTYIQAVEKPQQATKYLSLRPLMDKDGKIALEEGRLGLTLVNIEEERIHRNPGPIRRQDGSDITYSNPPIKLRLYLLITAYYSPENYETGLKFLSYAISFFNTHNLFTPKEYPSLHPSLERLTMELYSTTFEQMNQLWGAMGAKYLPSALYVAKLAPLDDQQVLDRRLPVSKIDFRNTPQGGPV